MDNLNRTNHPQINKVKDFFENETNAFRKIHRMIDLFETMIKTHTALLVSNYFLVNKISDAMKGYLAEGLKTPSLGVWQDFSRKICDELAFSYLTEEEFQHYFSTLKQKQQQVKFLDSYSFENGQYIGKPSSFSWLRQKVAPILMSQGIGLSKHFFIDGFYEYFLEWDNEEVSRVISIRNHYAHGSTPEDAECESHLNRLSPILEKWLKAGWLHDSTVVTFVNNGSLSAVWPEYSTNSFIKEDLLKKAIHLNADIQTGIPYLLDHKGNLLNLFPILLVKDMEKQVEPGLVFFNDLKRKKEVSYLHYPYAVHLYDKGIYPDFLSVINIEEWKKNGTDEFRERIAELTDQFKGRNEELETIEKYIDQHDKGSLLIHGNPGVGKSALAAEAIRQEKWKSHYVFKYFIRRGSVFADVNYFFDYLNKQVEQACKSSLPFGDTVEEKRIQLHKRLQFFSNQLMNGNKKAIFFIDGLDESEGESSPIIEYLWSQSYQNINFIYSSRKTAAVEQFYYSLPIEERDMLELGGLTNKDIRALLYQAVSKYDLDRGSPYIGQIQEKSQGNPLYIKLLCEALSKNELQLSDSTSFPKKIEDFYSEMISRFSRKEKGNQVLQTLFIMTAAKDVLSTDHLECIFPEWGPAVIENALSVLQEILYDSEQKEGHYQLFHESLRDFLKKEKPKSLIDAELKLIEFCRSWPSLKYYSDSIKEYPAKYFSTHLKNVNEKEELCSLSQDERYKQYQFKLTKQYVDTIQLHKDTLELSAMEKDMDITMKTGASLLSIYTKIKNSIPEIIQNSKTDSTSELQLALNRISLLDDRDKSFLYVFILSSLLSNADTLENSNKLQLVVTHIEKNLGVTDSDFYWGKFVPKSLLILFFSKIEKLGISCAGLLAKTFRDQEYDHESIWTLGSFLKHLEMRDYQIDSATYEICTFLLNHECEFSIFRKDLLKFTSTLYMKDKIEAANLLANLIDDDWQKTINDEEPSSNKLEQIFSCWTKLANEEINKDECKVAKQITVLLKNNDIQTAAELLNENQGSSTINSVIPSWVKAFAKMQDWNNALKWAESIQKETTEKYETVETVSVRFDAFLILIANLIRSGKNEEAEIIVQKLKLPILEFKSRNIRHHVNAYVSMTYSEEGEFSKALDYYKQAGPLRKSDVLPRLIFNAFKKGQEKEIFDVLLSDLAGSPYHLGEVCFSSDTKTTIQLLEELYLTQRLPNQQIQLDEMFYSETLMNWSVKNRHFQFAKTLLHHQFGPYRYHPDAILLAEAMYDDKPMEADQYLEKMSMTEKDPRGQITACLEICKLYLRKGNLNKALAFMNKAKNVILGDDNFNRAQIVYRMEFKTLITLFLDQGNMDASLLIEAAENILEEAEIYSLIAIDLSKKGNVSEALNWLHRISSSSPYKLEAFSHLLKADPDLEADPSTYLDAFYQLEEKEKNQAALSMLDILLLKSTRLEALKFMETFYNNSYNNDEMIKRLVDYYPIETVNEFIIRHPDRRDYARRTALSYLCQKNKLAESTFLVEYFKNHEDLFMGLLDVALLYFNHNHDEAARNYLQRAIGHYHLSDDKKFLDFLSILTVAKNLIKIDEDKKLYKIVNDLFMSEDLFGIAVEEPFSTYIELNEYEMIEDLIKRTDEKSVRAYFFEVMAKFIKSEKEFNQLLLFMEKLAPEKAFQVEILSRIIHNSILGIVDVREPMLELVHRFAFNQRLVESIVGYLVLCNLNDSKKALEKKRGIYDLYKNIIDLSMFEISDLPTYSYESLNDWIETIEDEDDHAMITLLAAKVKKGKISKDQFEKDVASFLA